MLAIVCAEVRYRCSWIFPGINLFDQNAGRHADKLDSDVHGYH